MSLAMPSPIRIGNTYYLKVRVPRSIASAAAGRTLMLPVADRYQRITAREFIKVSLGTGDRQEAKRRFPTAYAAVTEFFATVKDGPRPLSLKQSLALAGEARAFLVSIFDEDPVHPALWVKVAEDNAKALTGRLHPLRIPTAATAADDLESRFGAGVDILLERKGLTVTPKDRTRLLRQIAEAMTEAAVVNMRKASGDYSDSGETNKYPKFEKPKSKDAATGSKSGPTFNDVIDKEVASRSLGRDARPLPERTARKFRQAAEEFTAFRKSDLVAAVTAEEANAWKEHMLSAEALSNNSVKQRIQNLRTLIQWARKQSLGGLFPSSNPLELVTLPGFRPVPSDTRTFTMAEAKTALLAARKETRPELRWLPWLSAYSGARINELAQLTKADFFEVGGDWFYRLTTSGGRDLKNQFSERRIPVHPELIREGLREFIASIRHDKRIFPKRSQANISEWLRGEVGLKREGLAPNHGWRHLFEDLCLSAGMLDAARSYITGRSTGNSGEGYGKSEAMLPGLAQEMRKVRPLF